MFEVSLIDNVHSDMARLRGFYGHMAVESREVRRGKQQSGAN